MSLREHQIGVRTRGFLEDEREKVIHGEKKVAKPPKRVTEIEEVEQQDDSIRRMIGQAAIRTGIAILAVPDPLPIVDEVAGITLVAGGTYLIATS